MNDLAELGTRYDLIDIRPIPLNRPRITKTGHAYDSQRKIKQPLILSLKSQHSSRCPFEGPLKLTILYFFPVPKVHRKKIKEASWFNKSPDLDNLIRHLHLYQTFRRTMKHKAIQDPAYQQQLKQHLFFLNEERAKLQPLLYDLADQISAIDEKISTIKKTLKEDYGTTKKETSL